MASAWGRPPAAVAPRPTAFPAAETMTHPTLGFGALWPRAPSPSASASAIHLRSSLNPELLPELLELPLPLLCSSFARRHVLLLVGDDVGVRAVRGIELDLDHPRRRGGADLRVDDELDDDDGGA